jgi:uncharacterized protein
MAETLVSPGVLARENDSSFISSQPVTVGAAIIGPTVKGPVEIPTVVTSYSDYTNRFGSYLESGSGLYSYFTSIAAYNYFINGGDSLLVARVKSGSFTPASSSAILNTQESGVLDTAADALLTSITTNPAGCLAATYTSITLTGNLSGTSAIASTITLDSATNISAIQLSNGGSGFVIGETITIPSASLGASAPGGTDPIFTLVADDIVDGINAFTIKTISEGVIMNSSSSIDAYGALASGTANNLRFTIQNSSTTNGTFDLLVRQGNDTTNDQTVLETWTGLSLDPMADNYIQKVIGDQVQTYSVSNNQIETTGNYFNRSRYIVISAVNTPTPNYFDNNGSPKAAYATYLPSNQNGVFGAAVGDVKAGANFYDAIDSSNTQGLVGTDYDNMISLLANQDAYQYNILMTPGLYNSGYTSQCTQLINNTQGRGDNLLVLDLVPYNTAVSAVTAAASTRNTSYAASYWPWVMVIDPDTGKNVWVPASTVMAGVFAYNDSVSEPWFAPAGINRGGLGQVIRAEQKLTQANRDTLYTGKVNPIATFPGIGTVVYGQKTLQTRSSALDRVNVRRLLIQLKSYISQVGQTLVFEQNTIATRNAFLSQVNPYLESVQQRQGLYAFKVIMDDSNNTPDVIDRNQMIGQIYIQPTKTAEFIYLDFNILPTGATFPA